MSRITVRTSFFLLFLLPLSLLFGESSVSADSLGDGRWRLNYRAPEDPRILESIQQGLTSEILFQIRIYQDPRRFLGFRDGKLVLDEEIRVEGRWDRFNQRYIVTRDDRVKRFESSQEFLDDFLTLTYPPLNFTDSPGALQVLVRSRLTPMRLSPPFTLVQPVLAFREGRREPWLELEIKSGGNL